MSHGAKAGADGAEPATGISESNSPFVDKIRRDLQSACLHGAFMTVKRRLEGLIPPKTVDKQIEGHKARLTLDVFLELLRECPPRARVEILGEVLAPLNLVVHEAGEVADSRALDAALGLVMSDLGDVAKIVVGGVEPHERSDFAKKFAELEERLRGLKTLGGIA